tara:strand:- start:18 stop:287 length:270 start_codon:yes stop_codon:yes gene_type:complete
MKMKDFIEPEDWPEDWKKNKENSKYDDLTIEDFLNEIGDKQYTDDELKAKNKGIKALEEFLNNLNEEKKKELREKYGGVFRGLFNGIKY